LFGDSNADFCFFSGLRYQRRGPGKRSKDYFRQIADSELFSLGVTGWMEDITGCKRSSMLKSIDSEIIGGLAYEDM
jgi:hypothetical protein